MASVFTKIINNEIPGYKVCETNDFIAILDINPLKEGHTLVIPKKEVDYIFALEDETFLGLQVFAKLVAKAIEKAIPCKKIGMAVIGLEVPHTHIHLVPLDEVGDLNFSNPKKQFTPEQLEVTLKKIQDQL